MAEKWRDFGIILGNNSNDKYCDSESSRDGSSSMGGRDCSEEKEKEKEKGKESREGEGDNRDRDRDRDRKGTTSSPKDPDSDPLSFSPFSRFGLRGVYSDSNEEEMEILLKAHYLAPPILMMPRPTVSLWQVELAFESAKVCKLAAGHIQNSQKKKLQNMQDIALQYVRRCADI